jgi:hypothetical protein
MPKICSPHFELYTIFEISYMLSLVHRSTKKQKLAFTLSKPVIGNPLGWTSHPLDGFLPNFLFSPLTERNNSSQLNFHWLSHFLLLLGIVWNTVKFWLWETGPQLKQEEGHLPESGFIHKSWNTLPPLCKVWAWKVLIWESNLLMNVWPQLKFMISVFCPNSHFSAKNHLPN